MKVKKGKHVIIVAALGLLYFFGVAAIIYPMIGNVYNLSTSKAIISSYNDDVKEMDDSDIKEKYKNAAEYNSRLLKGVFDEELSRSLNMRDNIMCYVEVPSVDIYLPVYYGTQDRTLKKGCGWLEKTSLPVTGKGVHSVIAGHTGLPNAEMFTKLDQVKVGEVFYLKVLDSIFTYKIISVETVNPDRTDMLQIDGEKNFVTLLTCTPYGINDKRLLLKGELAGIKSKTEADVSDGGVNADPAVKDELHVPADEGLQRQISRVMFMITAITVGAVIAFAAACVWLGFVTKSKPKHSDQHNREIKSGDEDVKTEE